MFVFIKAPTVVNLVCYFKVNFVCWLLTLESKIRKTILQCYYSCDIITNYYCLNDDWTFHVEVSSNNATCETIMSTGGRKNVFSLVQTFWHIDEFLGMLWEISRGEKVAPCKTTFASSVVWNFVNLPFQLEHKANVLRAKFSKDAVTNCVHLQDEFRVQFCLAKIFRNKLLRMKICSVLSVLPFQISSLPM